MRKTIKRAAAMLAACVMALTVTASVMPADVSAAKLGPGAKAAKKAANKEFDPSGTYHAYFGFQQSESWIFRDEWYSDTLGTKGKDLKKANLDYQGGTLFQSGADGVTTVDGTQVTDAEITGNGTYTVSVTGLNGVLKSAPENAILRMIYVTTDIPFKAKDNPVTISNWKLKLDGSEVTLPEEIFYPDEYISKCDLLRFDPINIYQKEKGIYADCPDIMPPNDSIEITFTVSGFDSDNPDAVEASGDDTATSDMATSDAAAGNTTSSSSSGSSVPVVPIVIVVIVVVVVVVVVVKKKNS